MVIPIGFAERRHQVRFFKDCSDIDPHGPEHVEEQPIGGHVRAGPNEQDRKEIEGMANPQVRTADDELLRRKLLSTSMRSDGCEAKRVE